MEMNPTRWEYKHIDIDLTGKEGDLRFECAICHWGVTLKPSAAAKWTDNGRVIPLCAKDGEPLTVSVYRRIIQTPETR